MNQFEQLDAIIRAAGGLRRAVKDRLVTVGEAFVWLDRAPGYPNLSIGRWLMRRVKK